MQARAAKRTANRRNMGNGTGYRVVRRPACPPDKVMSEFGNGATPSNTKGETQAGSARIKLKARPYPLMVRRNNVKEIPPPPQGNRVNVSAEFA